MQNNNLYAHFDRQFESLADNELLCDSNGASYRYQDVARRSGQIANFLTRCGAQRGARISVQTEKSVENFCLYLACLRAGFVYHPLNIAYKANELDYFFVNAEPTVIICDPDKAAEIDPLANQAGAQQLLTLDHSGTGTLSAGADTESAEHTIAHCQADDLAALLYSSGTTGVPKGVMLTHSNLLSNTQTLVDAWGFTNTDRLLHALPIFHVHGLFVALGCVLLSGASMRWLKAFNADDVIRFLPECTALMGVPTYYTRLLAHPSFSAEATQSVRLFVSGSAPLLPETFAAFEEKTGHRILERYGMTETNMNTSNPLRGERKPGTVGPALAGVDVRIVDEDNESLEAGAIGNLQVRGPNVFAGYWKMPEKTAEDFTADGFFNTGDKGIIDDAGYVSIVGRSKDMVITGGINVYPKELELFIDTLEGVVESAVVGVPHDDYGEGVVAVIVRHAGNNLEEQEIVQACKKEFANFKVPKRVVFETELPRNAMAKVQKNALREKYHTLLTQ